MATEELAEEETIRTSLTLEERTLPLEMTIDPGFVHHKRIEAILSKEGMAIIDNAIAKLPNLPEGLKKARIDNIYTRVFVDFCGINEFPTLQTLLAKGNGKIFCSVETWLPCEGIDEDRATLKWLAPEESAYEVELHFSTEKVTGDTLRSYLVSGDSPLAVVALVTELVGNTLKCEPLIMGFAWIECTAQVNFAPEWYSNELFENFLEDFDEFTRVSELPLPSDVTPMKDVSENAFKICIAKLLGESPGKDWGGEQSDLYTAHLHLKGHRTTGAFLLKGPASFKPMTLRHLGKNADQIYRLANEPADVLFVQHCHEIQPAVRATLRAFAVQPGRARRYCLVDGRESLRLLYAYDLFDEAISLSKREQMR